jgi:PAS domain S-box-containing protein
VLLADDNADMRDYVGRLLADLYEVEAVPDGESALAAALARPPALVLTDVMMPGLDGFGLLRRLRGDPRTQAVPIVMLSARAGEEARVEGLEAGVDDYLIKPFGARELRARVSALLEMARIRREAARNERALRDEAEAARQRAVTILESITDGFLAIDRDWRFTYVNAAAERLTGLSRREVMGRDFWGTFPKSYESEIGARYRAAVTDQVTAVFDGLYEPWGRWFEIRAYPSKDGGLSIYFRDITDRKAAEAERERLLGLERQRTEQLQKLAEVSVRISAAHDVDSIVGVVTAEARDLLGALEANLRFHDDRDQAGPDTSLVGRVDSIVRRTNRPLRMDGGEVDAGGKPLGGWLAAPLVGRDGKNLGLIRLSDKASVEFTEDDEAILVQLAQMASVAVENARFYQELRDNDTRKNEFLAMLAHELRNPLAAINNSVRLSTSTGLKEDFDWSMGVIARQLKHLSRLIDDLLDVSRISRGKIDLRRAVVDVAPILDAALETVRPLVEERKHRLEVAVDRQNLWADADPTRLEQVATNLLMNAAKYSENEGLIRLSAAKEKDRVVISVKDRGVGIPPEKLPEMFELFAQGDRSLARSEGGLGIGLTVVKKLVELHGGSVSATSDGLGLGSEFTVTIPSASRPDATGQVDGRAKPAGRATARVLVVDDNVDTAKGLARLLRLVGHQVRVAHTGPEAIEAAREFRPEVVLLDIGLPGMDGYRVARTLRGEEFASDTTIVAVSGYGQEEDRRKSREAGFDHHMVKPVDLDDLLALLADARVKSNGV